MKKNIYDIKWQSSRDWIGVLIVWEDKIMEILILLSKESEEGNTITTGVDNHLRNPLGYFFVNSNG